MKLVTSLRTNVIAIFFIMFVGLFLVIPSAHAESVPDWIKNTAGWWATDAISETEFINAIQFLANNGIIQTNSIPDNMLGPLKPVHSWMHHLETIPICKENRIERELNYFETGILCSNIDLSYIYDEPDFSSTGSFNHNSYGFRGPEFSIEKSDDTFRIIAVGGSTTEGISKNDNETYPGFLQTLFEINDIKNVEVINAGVSGAASFEERNLIENKLMKYNPDLIIIYDGWNDLRTYLGEPPGVNREREPEPTKSNPELWMERWKEFCIENSNDVKTIIVLQPLLGMSDRLLTDFEYSVYSKYFNMINGDIPEYEKYGNQLIELSKYCTDAFDFRKIFNESGTNIFVDTGHVSVEGEKILAQNIFKKILPHVVNNSDLSDYKKTLNVIGKTTFEPKSEFDFRGRIIKNISFENIDLSNSVFWFSESQNIGFINNSMNNAELTYTNFYNVDFVNNELTNSKFSRSNIIETEFKKNNLDESNFSGAGLYNTLFHDTELKKSKFLQTQMKSVVFKSSDLSNSIFDRVQIINSKFLMTDSSNMEIYNSNFVLTEFVDFDFSKIKSKNNSFAGITFTNTNFNQIDNWKIILSANMLGDEVVPGSILNGLDLSGIDFSKTRFTYDSPYSKPTSNDFAKKIAVQITDANLSNTNFKNQNLVYVNFANSNLSGSDLSFTDLRSSNLEGANLEGANLEGAKLEGANLNCLNHDICIGNN